MTQGAKPQSSVVSGELRGADFEVQRIPVPASVRGLSMLEHVDYADAFVIPIGSARHLSAERCAREILSGAPLATRVALSVGWSSIGLMPALERSRRTILGWDVRENTSKYVLLGRDSLIGMPGELLFQREGDTLLFCTFVQRKNLAARAVWAATETRHLLVVRNLLQQAVRRLSE